MNIKNLKYAGLLLVTACFSLSLTSASFATEEAHEKISTVPQLFEVEFNEQSVKTYATYKGINFEDAKNTLGYKANHNRLTHIINAVNEVTKSGFVSNSNENKNCLASLLFATEIGLKINNFEKCSREDVKKMLYTVTLFSKGVTPRSDDKEKYSTGMSYLRGFLIYNMCQNALKPGYCLSLYDNFRQATQDLCAYFRTKCENDKTLEEEINSLLLLKYENIGTPININGELFMWKDLVRSALKDLDITSYLLTFGSTARSLFYNVERYFDSSRSIENELFSSKKSILEKILKKKEQTKENDAQEVQNCINVLDHISNMSRVCRCSEQILERQFREEFRFLKSKEIFWEIIDDSSICDDLRKCCGEFNSLKVINSLVEVYIDGKYHTKIDRYLENIETCWKNFETACRGFSDNTFLYAVELNALGIGNLSYDERYKLYEDVFYKEHCHKTIKDKPIPETLFAETVKNKKNLLITSLKKKKKKKDELENIKKEMKLKCKDQKELHDVFQKFKKAVISEYEDTFNPSFYF